MIIIQGKFALPLNSIQRMPLTDMNRDWHSMIFRVLKASTREAYEQQCRDIGAPFNAASCGPFFYEALVD